MIDQIIYWSIIGLCVLISSGIFCLLLAIWGFIARFWKQNWKIEVQEIEELSSMPRKDNAGFL